MKFIKLNDCPFCNSSTKWCGENETNPEDNHLCHQIVCTNKSCGARFDFEFGNQDLLPDETDDMTEEECMEPFRVECAKRFNARCI
ncbi:Uncharacterised protein [Serratia marcescens]|nr:Uncharacterised protein [Serratia marcescens]